MGDCLNPVPENWTPGWVTVLPPHVKDRLLKFYTEEELLTICSALARPPNATCVRVNTLKSTTEEFVPKLRAKLSALGERNGESHDEDSGSMPYGTVEPHSIIPDAVVICPPEKPALAVFAEGREVLVSRRCAESVLRGADVFVPGMMGCSPRAAKGDNVTVLCDVYDRFLRGSSTHILSTGKLDPKRMKGCVAKKIASGSDEAKSQFRAAGERLDHKYGREEGAIRISTAEERRERLPEGIVVIGKGTMEVDRREAMSAKEGLGCRMTECVFRAPPLNGVLPGAMYVQNLPSIVVPHVLAPRAGDAVLDMCASPGGKATHAATLLRGTGSVLALDRTEAKVQVIREWATALGLQNLKALKADSTMLLGGADGRGGAEAGGGGGREVGASGEREEGKAGRGGAGEGGTVGEGLEEGGGKGEERGEAEGGGEQEGAGRKGKRRKGGTGGAQGEGRPRLALAEESFDRIILDPPCTALGLRPRLAVDVLAIEMERTPGYQRQMLHVAARLLKPGGRLVYSTCTINPEENEANVAWALRTLPLALVPAEPRVGGRGRGGCGLSEAECEMVQRFEPGAEIDTNGFFLAAFEKRAA